MLRLQYNYWAIKAFKLLYISHASYIEVMKVVIIAVIGWACHLVAAQEKVCTSFCNSLGLLQSNPGKSCDDIYQINKASRTVSRNYWINTTTGVHQVYCDMELECGGHKGGRMRIADLDTSRGDDCPSGWTKIMIQVNLPLMCVDLQTTILVVIPQSLLSMELFITRFVVKQEAIRNIPWKLLEALVTAQIIKILMIM